MNNLPLIGEFTPQNINKFFYERSDFYTPIGKDKPEYDGDIFTHTFNQGELKFENGERVAVYTVFVTKELTERGCRKKQFDKAKDIIEMENATAGLFFFYDSAARVRFSFIFPIYEGVKRKWSHYKRHSYYLIPNVHAHTFESQADSMFKIESVQDIKEIFSIEKVTKEFYIEISLKFLELVGGERTVGSKRYKYTGCLVIPENNSENKRKFAVRLLGRLIFCWFLKMKKSKGNIPLIPEELLSTKAVIQIGDKNYYHEIVEPLFFEMLNKNRDNRHSQFRNDLWDTIPFLNGGLFEHDVIDFYELTDLMKSKCINTLIIPNEWFHKLFTIFELYNFTVDESTSTDIEIAVDPEMLGKIFENLLAELDKDTGETARKATGSYYTPRFVVEYIVDNSLCHYLASNLNLDYDKLARLVESQDNISSFSDEDKNKILSSLSNIKIVDPACGSGAFLMGAMQRMLEIISVLDPESVFWKHKIIESVKDPTFQKYLADKLKTENINYIIKLGLIRDTIYGVDILTMAVEISKLRFFLSLVVDETIDDTRENRGILALPNLEFKFIAADYLLDLASELESDTTFKHYIDELKEIINNYYMSFGDDKHKYILDYTSKQRDISRKLNETGQITPNMAELLNWNPFKNESVDWFNPDWMLGLQRGFDLVIGNPPYVSNKNTEKIKVPRFINKYGFSDDLYNYFFVRSLEEVEYGGIVSFITSNTYLSINSKQNLRELFLRNRIIELIKVDNPFENPMVDPAIISIQKTETSIANYTFLYKNAKKHKDAETDFYNPEVFEPEISIYKQTAFKTLFVPNEFNMRIWGQYCDMVNRLIKQSWEFISTSRNIGKNSGILNEYRKNLKPGDVTLLGLLTEGGQGLATADNGWFVGVIEGTKEAYRVKETRPQKLFEAIRNESIDEYDIASVQDAKGFLYDMSESEIREMFDDLKEEYGRDIFGSGYLYKILSKNEIVSADNMSSKEKTDGIEKSKPHYVLYDKGDKDGNRWYLQTPYCINWSKEAVDYLMSNSGKKGKGMPVVRNKDFYFREGFCWSDINTVYLKCRLKGKSIHDVKSMSLFSLMDDIPDWFFVCIINSTFISEYVNDFVNNTQTFQINDARQLPIIIPTEAQLASFKDIFDDAYAIKIKQFSGELSDIKAEQELKVIQDRLDIEVLEYYGLN